MFKQFAAQHSHLLDAAAPAGGQGASAADSDAGGGSSDSSSHGGSGSPASGNSGTAARPGLRRRLRQARQRWQLECACENLQRRTGTAAPAGQGENARAASPCWDSWGVPLLLAGLCWHAIDTLLW